MPKAELRMQGVAVPPVELQVDGQSHPFSPILLRDLCGCPQCVDPSTKQKYRPTTDIPATVRPDSVSQAAHGVTITWHDDVPGYGKDHTTDISNDVLRSYVQTGRTGLANFELGPQSYWNAAEYEQLPDMCYEEYMQSDSALYDVLRQLHTHGLAFVTGVSESEKSVSTIAERIGPIKNTFYGYTWDVRSVPESKNVAYTSQDLGFHMDLLYMEQPPHLQFLHCIRSSAAGGASLFTDSHRAAADLLAADMASFWALRHQQVDFHYNHPSSALYYQRRPVIELHRDTYKGGAGRMIADYARQSSEPEGIRKSSRDVDVNPMDHLASIAWSPPFQAPLGHRPPHNNSIEALEFANPKIKAWHAAAQKFNAMIHREEMIYERMMKPGECVLFDNRRVLHARKAFEVGDAGTERWLRGAYLDKDPYLSKMRVLEHRFANATEEKAREDADRDYFEMASATA